MSWLYVPGMGGSASPLSSQVWHIEPYVTLNGTPTQRPSSWRGWKRRPWIGLLSGMTLPPSTADLGVERWILSLPGFHVSRGPRLGSVVELTTTVGSGRRSPGYSVRFDRASSSWRTCRGSIELPMVEGYRTSWRILPTSGSMRNGVVSRRPPLEPVTDVNASGFSGWPTPVAGDSKSNGNSEAALARGFKGTLTDRAVRMWPTPRASEAMRGTDPERPGRTGGPSLKQALGLHRPTTTTDGTDGEQRADLNPRFVAALMGVPWDWLSPCTSVGTDSFHEWLRKHSLGSPVVLQVSDRPISTL